MSLKNLILFVFTPFICFFGFLSLLLAWGFSDYMRKMQLGDKRAYIRAYKKKAIQKVKTDE